MTRRHPGLRADVSYFLTRKEIGGLHAGYLSPTSCFLLSRLQFSFSSIIFRSIILWLHQTYCCCAANLCFSVCPLPAVYPDLWVPQLTLKRREAIPGNLYIHVHVHLVFCFLPLACVSQFVRPHVSAFIYHAQIKMGEHFPIFSLVRVIIALTLVGFQTSFYFCC